MEESKSKKSPLRIWIPVIILVLFFCVVIALIFLLQGNTTYTGSWPEPELTESLSCEGKNIAYPFFEYDNSKEKTIKINAVFNNDKLTSISLRYTLYYDDTKSIVDSENINHVTMSKHLISDDLGYDALGSYYSKANDSLQFGLYSEAGELNGVSSKYFLLDLQGSLTKSRVSKNYNEKGLDCVRRNV